ncbi:winged helix-turn-helix transcriptional regulator [Streptodolium elevatio]|uniref:Helix-turn-helix domain-containing protein n=1 Tax=Streptodolium elevatio TaxID=3157996 RepID=A0ABV3D952_9ACTN
MTSDSAAHGFVADCRLRAATELFAHTWDPVVLAALRSGPRRRGELRSAIGGISDKVLTESLTRLLGTGLIARQAYAEAPPRVEYRLTVLGESLVDGPLVAMAQWIGEYGDALFEAREGTDRRTAVTDTAVTDTAVDRRAGRRDHDM